MGKEADLIKAVKNNEFQKVEKILKSEKPGKSRSSSKKEYGSNFNPSCYVVHHVDHVNVNCKEPETGSTPLMIATLAGNRSLVNLLLSYGSSVTATDEKLNTALHNAVFKHFPDLVIQLIEAGAEINAKNSDGNTPLHTACQNAHEGKTIILQKLLQYNAKTNIYNNGRDFPLDIAVTYKKKDIIKTLMEHDPNLRRHNRALVLASRGGSTQIVELLLDYGINPNELDRNTGTGPLHEAVRFDRYDAVKLLLSYGADPFFENTKHETADGIAVDCPNSWKAEKVYDLVREYKNLPVLTPRYVSSDVKKRKNKSSEFGISDQDYPLLANKAVWTSNTPTYCNSCTAKNPNTNILNGDPTTFWVIPSSHHIFCNFDLQNEHIITGIRITGWNSQQMIKTCVLSTANAVMGPWKQVTTFVCERLGSDQPSDPGKAQDFTGFCGTGRYWRFDITDNYGGRCTCFQGIQFYGFDMKVTKFFKDLSLDDYLPLFVKKGFNQFDKLLKVKQGQLDELEIKPSHAELITSGLKKERLKVYPLTSLRWLQTPEKTVREGDILSPFSVYSDPMVEEEVQLELKGQKKECKVLATVELESDNPQDAPVAEFRDITLPAGDYTLVVRGVRFPKVLVETDYQIHIDPKVKDESEIAEEFKDIEDMLKGMQDSLASVDLSAVSSYQALRRQPSQTMADLETNIQHMNKKMADYE